MISEPEIISVPYGTKIFKLEYDCHSTKKPTAELWINLGQPFFSKNIKKMYNLPVIKSKAGWTASVDILVPFTPKPPKLMKEKRWILFKNEDGITKGPEFQILVE